jgi:hypothetical protein
MNWPLIWTCLAYGILCALWQAGSSIYVIDSWPDNLTWLKIASSSVVAFCGGVFLYLRAPGEAWKTGPGGK